MPRRNPSASRNALLVALSAAFMMAAAPAHPAGDPAENAHNYSIPPGPLGRTLSSFAAKSGVALSFDHRLTEGLNSAGLSGNHTTRQGFARLLDGSGLELFRQADGSYGLRRLPRSGAATLPEVRVTASAEHDGTTEGTDSYKATATNTATKLSLTPRETPQTISVVTSQQMRDFGMTSVDDALKAVSGVYVQGRGVNGAEYFSRGFLMQSQFDGIPNPIGISNNGRNPQIDNAFIDRAEVLQGAAGLLTGGGQPGGTINLVRKRPTQSFQAEAEVRLAQWDGRRIVGDVSGPLTESGRIRGRLVASADDSKSFVDYVYRNRRAVYGVVEADLTPTTTLEASVQHQQETGRNHYGAPFASDGSEPGIRRSAFFGDGGGRTTKDYTLTTLGLTQRLPGDWQAKAQFTHGKQSGDTFGGVYVSGELDAATGDGLVLNRLRSTIAESDSKAADLYASGPFQLFGRKHEAAFGLNGSSFRWAFLNSGWVRAMPINVHTFDPGALSEATNGSPIPLDQKTTQWGAYGVARFSVTDSLKLITGVRMSNYKDENLLTRRTNTKESGVISPYAGLVYDLTPQASVYASYSDIFSPQTQRSVDGGTIKPVVGSNYEVGIKGELLDKRLNVSAAVFRLEQTNLARRDDSVAPDPGNACGGTCYIAADKVISQGIDLGISGELAQSWNVAGGYTYTDSKYASGAMDGLRFRTNLPRQSLRLSTAYKLPGTGWTAGGSLSARGKMHLSGTSAGVPYTMRSGGLVLVGLMAKYEINPNAELTLAVSNLFDRTYRETLDTKNYSTFGEARRISASLKYRF